MPAHCPHQGLRQTEQWLRTSLQAMIWPLAFLTRRSFFKKYLWSEHKRRSVAVQTPKASTHSACQEDCCLCPYQNLLLPRTASGAQTRMRYTVGLGSASVGRWRPTTWYWCHLNRPYRKIAKKAELLKAASKDREKLALISRLAQHGPSPPEAFFLRVRTAPKEGEKRPRRETSPTHRNRDAF